jgi:hypothetical protein
LAIGALVAFGTLRQADTPRRPLRGRAHSWLMEPPLVSRFAHPHVVG